MKFLLANKASIDAKSDYGETAFFLAADHGQTEVAELLMASNADINAGTTSGERPLLEAAFRGDTELVKVLLAKNVDVNAKEMDGSTALDQAAGGGHKEIVELLLANKAHMDQWTLDYAVLGLHDDVAELLLKNGADVNLRETNGQTPLLVLTDSDSNAYGASDVDFLLTNKANINARDSQGNTALHYAALYGHADIVKLLLARGASAGLMNLNGQTPLDLAKTNTQDAFFPNQKYHLCDDIAAAAGYPRIADIKRRCLIVRCLQNATTVSLISHEDREKKRNARQIKMMVPFPGTRVGRMPTHQNPAIAGLRNQRRDSRGTLTPA